jgi:hypothetical protein
MGLSWLRGLVVKSESSKRVGGRTNPVRRLRFLPKVEVLEERWTPSTTDGGLGGGLLGGGLGGIPQPGQLGFGAATSTVMENGSTATITVVRTGGSDGPVTVNYATGDGSATAGKDYASTQGLLSFATGETTKTFSIPILNDGQVDGAETVNLTLSNATGGATLANPSTAVLTIEESVPPTITSLSPPSTPEQGAGFTLTVTGAGFTSDATVRWNNSNLPTTVVNGAQLQAQVPASLLAEEGTASVTVVSSAGTSNALTFSVTDPGVIARGVAVTATAGVGFTGQAVASFTDPGGAEPNASDPSGTAYTASIDWGDGTPGQPDVTPGTVSGPDAGGAFTVSGSHTYAAEGSYTITTTVSHEGAPSATVTSSAVIQRVPPPTPEPASPPAVDIGNAVSPVNPALFVTAAGSSQNANLALTLSDPLEGPHYGFISWGDGQSQVVALGSGTGGFFPVTHRYPKQHSRHARHVTITVVAFDPHSQAFSNVVTIPYTIRPT